MMCGDKAHQPGVLSWLDGKSIESSHDMLYKACSHSAFVRLDLDRGIRRNIEQEEL